MAEIREFVNKDANHKEESNMKIKMPNEKEIAILKHLSSMYGKDEIKDVAHWDGECWKAWFKIVDDWADKKGYDKWDCRAVMLTKMMCGTTFGFDEQEGYPAKVIVNGKKQWQYVDKVGNPTEPGEYWVTLIYDEYRNNKPTGRTCGFVSSRYFADLSKEPDLAEWAMKDQPKEGLVWTSECGGYESERVLAWMPVEEVKIADLPDGVIYDKESK